MKRSLKDALPRWLLTWLLSFALAMALGELLELDCRWWLAASLLLIFCAVLALAERFGRFWAMLAFWAAALVLCLLLAGPGPLLQAARAAVARTGGAGAGAEPLVLLLGASLALPLSFLLRFYWARAALGLGALALWIAAALTEWPMPRPVPAALIPFLLLTLTETIRRLRREPEPGKPLRLVLLMSLMPAALLLALLPARAEPYDFPLLRSVTEKVERIWHNTETNLRYRHTGTGQFGVNFNGVSDKSDMREGDEEDSRVIYVTPGTEPYGTVYLVGNAWNHFDGKGWFSTLRPETADLLNWKLDTAQHVYALWRLSGSEHAEELFSDCFRVNSVYLVCHKLNLRTMFTVMNTTRVFTDEERYPYADSPTGSLFDYVQRNDVWYRVHYLEANVRTRSALIAAAEGMPYDAEAHGPRWSRVARDFRNCFVLEGLMDNTNMERTFAERESLIRSVYLDCDGVSDRARALAEQITAECGSDSEKVYAIAAYLRENYSYTAHPEPVPEGENFLDYFLFERREGFCSWYATAAALLARSVGVPARYVQGFRAALPAEVFTMLGAEDAHAWCECYISGYGWLGVEATPGYGEAGSGWLTSEEEMAVSSTGTEPLPAPSYEYTWGDGDGPGGMFPDFSAPPETDEAEEQPDEEPESGEQSGDAAAAESGSSFEPFSIPLAVALTAALAAALWFLRRLLRKRRYAKADPTARLTADLERLLRDLRGKGYPRKPEEPLRLYFERIPWHYLIAREDEAKEMAALYDRTFFGLVPPSEMELARHRDFAARFRPKTLRQWLIWYGLQ